MTVCIAAACDNGERIVTATDCLLSLDGLTSDALAGKVMWLGEWQVMYAGTPANTALITREIEELTIDAPDLMSRRHIQSTVARAFGNFFSRASMFEALLPFGISAEEFRKDGAALLGEETHADVANQIRIKANSIAEQLLVTGWGISPISAMIYEIGCYGEALHSYDGYAAIGSGAHVANSHLTMLGQARHRTLAETIFNVAVAKFASEKSGDLDVGQNTALWVSRKRTEGDEHQFASMPVSYEDIRTLRELWAEHVRLRIPDEARQPISRIAASFTEGKSAIRDMFECINASNRLQEKKVKAYEEIKATIGQDLQSTTGDPSLQQPSQGLPGGTDES